MRSLSFLISRRWVLFAVVVALLAWLAWWLGEWQFHRLEDRKERNAVVERNLDASPKPVDEVFSLTEDLPASSEWQRVEMTGTYDDNEAVVVRYRTRDGDPGVDVVVPLVGADGTALIVDRGWFSTDNAGARPEVLPASPEGTVTVTGWARADASGRGTSVTEGSTRAIDSQEIADHAGMPAYQGFVELDTESPEAAEPLGKVELPDLGKGPHFFYGLQWWFFGLMAIFGFGYLAYDERQVLLGRKPPREKRARKGSE